MFKNYIYMMKETFFKKSLNRIFQELYSKNHKGFDAMDSLSAVLDARTTLRKSITSTSRQRI